MIKGVFDNVHFIKSVMNSIMRLSWTASEQKDQRDEDDDGWEEGASSPVNFTSLFSFFSSYYISL